MTPEEIILMKAAMEKQQEEDMAKKQQEMEMQASIEGEVSGEAGAATPGAPMAGPTPEEAGGQEGLENVPPTANEEKVSSLETLRELVLDDDKKQVISRIIKKQQQKA